MPNFEHAEGMKHRNALDHEPTITVIERRVDLRGTERVRVNGRKGLANDDRWSKPKDSCQLELLIGTDCVRLIGIGEVFGKLIFGQPTFACPVI